MNNQNNIDINGTGSNADGQYYMFNGGGSNIDVNLEKIKESSKLGPIIKDLEDLFNNGYIIATIHTIGYIRIGTKDYKYNKIEIPKLKNDELGDIERYFLGNDPGNRKYKIEISKSLIDKDPKGRDIYDMNLTVIKKDAIDSEKFSPSFFMNNYENMIGNMSNGLNKN